METPGCQEWGAGAMATSGWAGAAPQHPTGHGAVPGQRRVGPQMSAVPGGQPRTETGVFPSSGCEESGPHLVLSVGFPKPRPALFKRCSQMDGKWTQKHASCSRTLTRKGPPASSAPEPSPVSQPGAALTRAPVVGYFGGHTAWPHPAPHGPLCWLAADELWGDPQPS